MEDPALTPLALRFMFPDPDDLEPLFSTFPAPCSIHGRLLANCERVGLTAIDRFDGVLVSSGLYCEPCGTPASYPLDAIANLSRTGPVPIVEFWNATGPRTDPSRPLRSFDLVAFGTLDPFSRNRIAKLTSGLEATHLLEFRFREETTEDRAIGFLLFVNPEAERPIIGIEPTTPTWDGDDYRREIGNWTPLYEAR
ncbi:MAG: hypothetical protein R3C39_16460 [Dehalococcoidia bacterium]